MEDNKFNSEDIRLYTVKEVSKILHTNTTYVYDLIKAKKIPALKLGSYKVRHSALVEFLTINENNDLTNPYDIKPL